MSLLVLFGGTGEGAAVTVVITLDQCSAHILELNTTSNILSLGVTNILETASTNVRELDTTAAILELNTTANVRC